MDPHRHEIFLALMFSMAIQHIMIVVVSTQQLAIGYHYEAMTMDVCHEHPSVWISIIAR